MRRMPGVSWAWLRGSATPVECSFAPAIIKAASNLVVSGLGAIHRSGAGTLCVEGLKEHAVQVACKYIFLVPLDADAATFWKAHGFAACVTWNPVSMGLGPADVQALQDVLYIPDPTDCDVMAYPASTLANEKRVKVQSTLMCCSRCCGFLMATVITGPIDTSQSLACFKLRFRET